MSTDSIPYYIIAAGIVCAVIAGTTFPGYYSIAWGVLCGALTVLGVTMAQANAFDEGREIEREGEE
jgi:hypothetical protein